MKKELSNCCGAPITTISHDEGTCYYECHKCKKACDIRQEKCTCVMFKTFGWCDKADPNHKNKHICCNGECNHDDCCGKVKENCPNSTTLDKILK